LVAQYPPPSGWGTVSAQKGGARREKKIKSSSAGLGGENGGNTLSRKVLIPTDDCGIENGLEAKKKKGLGTKGQVVAKKLNRGCLAIDTGAGKRENPRNEPTLQEKINT